MIRSRMLAVAALTALPLAGTTPAEAIGTACGGTYPAVNGVASQQCPFVWVSGPVTATVSITGQAAGHKYVTIGVHPGGPWCEDESFGTSASCSFTYTPRVAPGTVMSCSSAAVGRPSGIVTYSCR